LDLIGDFVDADGDVILHLDPPDTEVDGFVI